MITNQVIDNILYHKMLLTEHSDKISRLRKLIEGINRSIDEDMTNALESAMLPIADEMRRIFDEQEEEVMRNLEQFRGFESVETRARFLTADSLMDFPRWIGETSSRLAGHVVGTMRKAWCIGLALLGKECDTVVKERFVQQAINLLSPLNDEITRTTRRKIEEMVDRAIQSGMSIDEFKEEMRTLFEGWKVVRVRGVSVFNVTYPFNLSLSESFKDNGIEYKMWVNQEMLGNFAGEVRPTHQAAGGQVVHIDETFVVGNAQLMFPGDLTQIASHPEELFGCRCMIKPVLDPENP